MVGHAKEEPDYGNWVSAGMLYVFAGINIPFLGIAIAFPVYLFRRYAPREEMTSRTSRDHARAGKDKEPHHTPFEDSITRAVG